MNESGSVTSTSQSPDDARIDVWIVPLLGFDDDVHALTRCLPAEERARCSRVADPLLRRRAEIARAALRHLLARALGVDQHGLVILRGHRGKPYVAGVDRIDFSLSHSRDVALVAIAPAPVGVDVEHDRTVGRLARAARRIMHPDTLALLDATPEPGRTAVFLDAWTLREAHVKAVGGGLFHTPDTLPFHPVSADARPVIVQERGGGARWTIARFHPAPGARAAVVAAGEFDRLHVHDADATRHILLEETS